METEYSKRVYQGVRVKHTVKDLLAEKRSRQMNVPRYSGGTSPSQPPFVQMPGSHMLPGYYGLRRPFISDSELCHPSKQFPAESFSSSLGGKPLSCDTSLGSGYSSLIDSYYSESFGDYRSAAFQTGGASVYAPSPLSSLLPPFSGESSHFLLKESWEQSEADAVSQTDGLCPGGLDAVSAPASMAEPEPGSPSQCRASSRSAGLSSSQQYSIQSLDQVHYPAPYPSTFSCGYSPFLPSDLASKMPPLSAEEPSSPPAPLNNPPSWGKEDGGESWSPYEIRRGY